MGNAERAGGQQEKTTESMIYAMRDLSATDLRLMIGSARMIVEIGCNDGTDSVQLARQFPEAQIHCFECEPRAIEKFERNVHEPNVTLHKVALTDVAGEQTFYQSGGYQNWDKSGSLRKPTFHLVRSPEITFDTTIVVPTATLDSFGLSPDLIWEDTQGNSHNVFAGGTRTLEKTRWLKTECHMPTPLYEGAWSQDQVIEFFKGWTCVMRAADDLLLRNDNFPREGLSQPDEREALPSGISGSAA